MSEFKRFKSPEKNKIIRVCNTSGHTAIITNEFSEVPKSLWGLAYSEGAIPEDIKSSDQREFVKEQKALKASEEEKTNSRLKIKLKHIYDNPNDYLTGNGNLIMRKALKYINEPVSTAVIDKLWNEVVFDNTIKS